MRKNTGYLKDVRKAREKPGFLELGNTDYLQVTSSESAGANSYAISGFDRWAEKFIPRP